MTVSRHTSIHTNTPPQVDIRPVGRADPTAATRGLTARDAALLEYLDRHRVLTALQAARLVFGSYSHARSRIAVLHSRGVLARFRRRIWPGSQPWRYTLGPLGAAARAVATGEALPRAAAVNEKVARLAHAANTEHLLGVNDLFAALAGYARSASDDDGCRLDQWWPESQTRAACGDIVRPDGYGEWTHAGRTVGFFYEHYTGTEPLDTLVGKVAKYGDLAEAGIARPVLFRLPGSTREQHLRHALERAWPGRTPAPVATVAADQLGPACYDITPASPCPAEAVWLPAGRRQRLRPADLHIPDVNRTRPQPETGWEAA
jgi:hypothetical protein